MSPILGIWASAAQPPLYAGSFESIATVTVGAGGSSTITFSSIPSTYTHLQVRFTAIPSTAASNYRIRGQFNSDTGANYATHLLYGNGTSANAAAGSSLVQMSIGASVGGLTSNMTTVGIFDVLDYANTNKYKTVRSLAGGDYNGNGEVDLNSGLWMNTSAITSISLYFDTANLAQYSHFALYGIKGS